MLKGTAELGLCEDSGDMDASTSFHTNREEWPMLTIWQLLLVLWLFFLQPNISFRIMKMFPTV